MADRKPIRWFVPQGGESFMGIAAYYLTHEENMRKSFSQPSRSVRRTLPDGTTIDYIMNDVVDCIRILPPQRMQRAVGKNMTWDTLPPFIEGTENIDLSQMTEDPDVSGGYYCTVSVINGTDANGRMLPVTFSVKMSTGSTGWSIEQGIRQTDGSYKVDGKNATLKLASTFSGDCELVARDGETELKKGMSAPLLKGHYIKCHSVNDGTEYYGRISEYGNISSLCSYSSLMKKYNEVSLERSILDYSETVSSSVEIVDTDTGWYWTGGAHNTVIDGVTIPISHRSRITSAGSITTTVISYTYSLKGDALIADSITSMVGSVTTTYEGKWIHVFTLETVYLDDDNGSTSTQTWNDIIPTTHEDISYWAYEDLYYVHSGLYSSALSNWDDKPMDVSQLSLREDSGELLFINPTSHRLGFRTMPGGTSITSVYVEPSQTVNGVFVEVDGYSCENVFFLENDEGVI